LARLKSAAELETQIERPSTGNLIDALESSEPIETPLQSPTLSNDGEGSAGYESDESCDW
jgi:hypothetical protein